MSGERLVPDQKGLFYELSEFVGGLNTSLKKRKVKRASDDTLSNIAVING